MGRRAVVPCSVYKVCKVCRFPHHHHCRTTDRPYTLCQPTPLPPTLLGLSSYCSDLRHTLLTAPSFTGNLDVPSLLPRWDVFVAPLLLPGVFNLQVLQALPVFPHSFRTTPFTSNIGVPPGCLGGSARGFLSRLVALMIRLNRVVDFHFPPRSFSVAALCIPFQVSIHVFFDLVSAVPFSPDQTDLVGLTTLKVGGPWSATSGPPLRRRPLMTVGRPPPTAIVES